MFENTRGMIYKTIEDLKKLVFSINICSMLIYIIYLVYAITAKPGIVWTNILLLIIVSMYFVFYIVKHNDIDQDSKEEKRVAKTFYKWTKK